MALTSTRTVMSDGGKAAKPKYGKYTGNACSGRGYCQGRTVFVEGGGKISFGKIMTAATRFFRQPLRKAPKHIR